MQIIPIWKSCVVNLLRLITFLLLLHLVYHRDIRSSQEDILGRQVFPEMLSLALVTKQRGCRYCVNMDIDRKSTRLNSSHVKISYAVFCLKKKNRNHMQ